MFTQTANTFSKLKTYTSEDHILIYQMGKVGSSALEKALEKSVHLHTLYMNGPCNASDQYIFSGIKGQILLLIRDMTKRILFRQRKEIKIIVPVREPVARNISMFFQGLTFWTSDYIKHFERETRHADINWLWQVFNTMFDHQYCDSWFDKEIKRFTGIDIFQHPFDMESGFMILRNGKYSILLIRTEDLEKNIDIINSFTGKNISLNRVNDGSSKWYSCIYHQFKDSINENSSAILKTKNGIIAKHFGYQK